MTVISDGIGNSIPVYSVLGALGELIYIAVHFAAAMCFLKTEPKKKALPYVLPALLAILMGATRFWRQAHWDGYFFDSTAELLYPYLCMAFLLPRKKILRGFLLTFGYTFVEAVKYIILIVFFRYDNDNVNDPLELLVEVLLNTAVLLGLCVLYRRRVKKGRAPDFFLTLDPKLFLLIVTSLGVFVASLALFGSHYDAGRQAEFVFTLLNIPLLAATVGYTVYLISRGRQTAARYQAQLDMQVQYYERLETMNEDMRIFRHDLPKKLRPLITYLEEDKTSEAKALAASLSGFADAGGRRYNSGNFRLDTVLYTEAQLAKKDGIEIVLPFGSVFPKDGIAADDIYTIFPNALDNAIEACRKVEADRRVITVNSKIVGDTVFVSIKNPISGDLTVKNGAPVTDKTDKNAHGYGWRSMKKAAAEYGDDNLGFTVEDGYFELRLSLRFQGSGTPEPAQDPREQPAGSADDKES